MIRSQNVYNNRFEHDGLAFIGDEHAGQLENVTIEKKDVLLNITGDSVARVCQVPDNILPARVNQHVAIVRPHRDKLDPTYLRYYLTSPVMQSCMLGLAAVGATRNALTKGMIESFEIAAPAITDQRAIAKILSDLDEKIELNHQMNKSLEHIAQAIFKRWFVDFEFPDDRGRPYKSSGGKMVDSELGEIPEGWEVKKLGEIGELKNGINYSREEDGDTEFSIINVRNLVAHNFILESTLDKIRIDSEKAKDYLLKEGDIVIARSASPGETIFIFQNFKNLVYSGFSIRYRPNNLILANYLFNKLQSLKDSMSNISDGTTLKNINQETLKSILFIIPSNGILKEYNLQTNKLFNKTMSIMNESLTLSQIRDSLLPRLMSGKIKVSK